MIMTARWSPYFANPPFVVVREVRKAASVGYIGASGLTVFGLLVGGASGPALTTLVAGLLLSLFFGTAMTCVGLWVLITTSKRAARRIDQPLVVVWPGRPRH